MPKHGQRWSGRFNEFVGEGPILWGDEEPKYFKLPSTPEEQDALQDARRKDITARMAATAKRAVLRRQATQPRQAGAPVAPRSTYFKIPGRG